jgi:iron complex outermembrane recepter protein
MSISGVTERMNPIGLRRALVGLIGAVLIWFAPLARASDPADEPSSESADLPQIVVTATRRAENIQDVPISLSAISQDQIDVQGIRGIDDLTSVTPGVTFQRMGTAASENYNDENSDINIRGIDSTAGTSTTAIYIDDSPIQTRHIAFGSVNAFPVLFDLDRVEVLRGPQGTLFGASAEGGAVRFITPEPSLQDFSGYLRGDVSTIDHGDQSYTGGAAIGGPIMDGVLAFRASVSVDREGGWVDRASYSHPGTDPLTPPVFTGVTGANANWQQSESARLALKWVPLDGLSVTPSIHYQQLHINDTAAYWVNLSDAARGIFRNGDALTDPSTDWFWLAALKITWGLGWADLTSNTSYFERQQRSISDFTQYIRLFFLGNPYPHPGDAGVSPFSDTQDNFYKEVRLTSTNTDARIRWTTGLFFEHLDENVAETIYDTTISQEFDDSFGIPLCGADGALGRPCPNGELFDRLHGAIDKQIAGFGELSVKLIPTLTATVGLRVSRDTVNSVADAIGGALIATPGARQTQSETDTPVTPKAVLSWQPDRDGLYYVSATKGYRVGGANVPSVPLCNGDLAALGIPAGADGLRSWPQKYSPDSLWSYEIGSKNSLLERKLIVNTSVFLVRWKDIQQNVYLPDCGNEFVANQGQVMSRGGDIDMRYLPLESVTLGLTASYVDAKFLETECAGASTYTGTDCLSPEGVTSKPIVSEGDRLLGAPWNFHFSGEATHGLALLGGSSAYLRLDYQLTSAQNAKLAFQDPRNVFFDTTIPGLPLYKELGARGGLRFKGFDLSIYGENLTDAHPLMLLSRDIPPILPSSPPDNLYYGRSVRPRTVGITGSYHF